MKKIIGFKIFVGIIITFSVLTATILFLVPREEIYEHLYREQNLEVQTGISSFEAELNYDGIVQQTTGNQELTGLSTYPSSDDLQNKILRLRHIYQSCKWICGLGILLAVAGLIVLRNQKWYECLNLSGCITVGTGIVLLLVSLMVKPIRLFVWQSQYDEYLGFDPLLVSILPEKWALYMVGLGLLLILIIGMLFMLLHLGSRKSYKPHKF